MKTHKSVLVIGMNGIGLMPTTPWKARVLLEEGKAEVYRKTPFTVNYHTPKGMWLPFNSSPDLAI